MDDETAQRLAEAVDAAMAVMAVIRETLAEIVATIMQAWRDFLRISITWRLMLYLPERLANWIAHHLPDWIILRYNPLL